MTASFTLFALTCKHQGSFDPRWPNSEGYALVEPILPAAELGITLDLLTTTVRQAQERAREAIALPASLQRHAFNPLIERPFVDFDGGLRYAPQPKFILRSMATENLYYRGRKRWGVAFGPAFGARVEAYTGMQLRHTGHHHVIPEFQWRKNRAGMMRSSDWFLITPAATILIECKSARMSLEAKAGTGAADQLLERYVGHAYQQLSNNAAEIAAKNPDYAHIPADRPLVGLVVTAEPMFGANSAEIRNRFGDPSLPVLTASLHDIELISSLSPKVAGEALTQIVGDPHLITWSLAHSLIDVIGRNSIIPNRLIQEAFTKLTPFSDPRRASRD